MQHVQIRKAPGTVAVFPELEHELSEAPMPVLRKTIRTAMIIVAVLVVGLGGLAAFIPITGAVIAPGSVSVESSVKNIAHPFGGVVSDILVKNGDRVAANQVLVRLDTTVSGAASDLTGQSVDQLLAREARLIAERDGAGSITFPEELLARRADPQVAAILADENRNFDVRRNSRSAQIAQLNQRAQQASADIAAYRSQLASYSRQSELMDEELEQTRELYRQRYTTLNRLNSLERSAAGLDASRGTASANIAQSSARISEMRAEANSVQALARSDAAAELVQVQAALAETRREKVAADDNFERGIIRAPQAGIVDKLTVKSIGAVISPGQDILEIVPDSDNLTVEAVVSPADIDQLSEGQKAVLLFSGLNRQTTPEIKGRVSFVSPDRTTDETGASFYRVTIAISEGQLERLGNVQLRVGMPVEAFIQSGDRTILSFLTRPLMDQIRRAFRSH